MDHTVDAITRIVSWVCRKLSLDELITATSIMLSVINDERADIKPRDDFLQKHPKYRRFTVDPEVPLTAPPPVPVVVPSLDYRQIMAERRQKTGRELAPVRRRKGSCLPPDDACCESCSAPARYLYVNDGKKGDQLLCKVCGLLFPSNRVRRESDAKYWCPHCHWALYRWKEEPSCTIYKCPNDRCPGYLHNRGQLNRRELALCETGMSSQFKLRYQYREYRLTPADLSTAHPDPAGIDLGRIRNHYSTLALVLSYSVSFGLSARMTALVLSCMHGIEISHQTVQNYLRAAAVLADRFNHKYAGPLKDGTLAGDETYIKVADEWQYTWFVIGAESKAIRAYHVSEKRDAIAATATLSMALGGMQQEPALPIEFVADGLPSYDNAVQIINADAQGTPKPLTRRKVVGLRNLDAESEQFRAFKQLIERLNRTYKFHVRARTGFKNQQGAIALTALFVAYYNFLRPHGSLKGRTPIHVKDLDQAHLLQGQWLKLLELAAAA